MKTNHIEVINQDYGGRYQEVDRHSITVNSQYSSIGKSKIIPSLGNAVKIQFKIKKVFLLLVKVVLKKVEYFRISPRCILKVLLTQY